MSTCILDCVCSGAKKSLLLFGLSFLHLTDKLVSLYVL